MSRMSHPPAVGPSEPEISVINVISDQQNQNPSFREKSDNYAGRNGGRDCYKNCRNGSVVTAIVTKMTGDSEEDVSMSTSTEVASTIINNNVKIINGVHIDKQRRIRSASADRILDTGESRSNGKISHGELRWQNSDTSYTTDSPSPLLGTSWTGVGGLDRRRYWRRSWIGSQSLSFVGNYSRHSQSHLRHSSDILDTMPTTSSTSVISRTRSRIDEVESGLFIGNMDAATDVLGLELHNITHIVTVDTVPLPRKITSLLPRLACLHIQVCDIPSEDLLSHFPSVISFMTRGMEAGSVLVHCYHGKSRSATLVTAFLMAKYKMSVEKALSLLKSKRKNVNPNPGFMAQLRLWEAMRCRLESEFLRYKMYKLHIVSEKIRKSKLLSQEASSSILDPDPGLVGRNAASRNSAVIYKCKQCRRVLATCDNLIPHVAGQSPYWYTCKPRDNGTRHTYCTQTVSINPMAWMEEHLRSNLSGKLCCPHCRTKVGTFSWVLGYDCKCGANLSPAFVLDMTGLIFKTGGRHLHTGSARQPVVV